MWINVTIEGRTPLLMHKFTDEAQQDATAGTRSNNKGGDPGTAAEQAQAVMYTDETGTISIPQPNLFRCIIDAGKYHKVGRSKVTTQKSSLVPAAVELEGVMLPLDYERWDVDTRPIRIPATGGRVLRHRPSFEKWSLSFTVNLDTSMIAAQLLRDIVDSAGSNIGLGDFRPDTKGPFGKFVVTKWDEEA